jgi:hypothetical protein
MRLIACLDLQNDVIETSWRRQPLRHAAAIDVADQGRRGTQPGLPEKGRQEQGLVFAIAETASQDFAGIGGLMRPHPDSIPR